MLICKVRYLERFHDGLVCKRRKTHRYDGTIFDCLRLITAHYGIFSISSIKISGFAGKTYKPREIVAILRLNLPVELFGKLSG